MRARFYRPPPPRGVRPHGRGVWVTAHIRPPFSPFERERSLPALLHCTDCAVLHSRLHCWGPLVGCPPPRLGPPPHPTTRSARIKVGPPAPAPRTSATSTARQRQRRRILCGERPRVCPPPPACPARSPPAPAPPLRRPPPCAPHLPPPSLWVASAPGRPPPPARTAPRWWQAEQQQRQASPPVAGAAAVGQRPQGRRRRRLRGAGAAVGRSRWCTFG